MKYRVKTSYLGLTAGKEFDYIDRHHLPLSDQVALQAGFLEEVKEASEVEQYIASITKNVVKYAMLGKDVITDEQYINLANVILTYLRSRMPNRIHPCKQYHPGYKLAINDVLRDVFGERVE